MSSLLTHIAIMNAALARFGEDPLQTFDDETIGGLQAQLVYEDVVDLNLGVYLFSWAKQISQLSLVDGAPALGGFTNVFDLPPERIGGPLYVTDDVTDPDRRFSRYALIGEQIHADESPLYAMHRFRPNPNQWSAAFKACTITGLASRCALAIAGDKSLAADLHREAWGSPEEEFQGGLMRAAIKEDARATPPRQMRLDNNPLSRARFRG